MKRDMNLVREILLSMEKVESSVVCIFGQGVRGDTSFDGISPIDLPHSHAKVMGHLVVMEEAGLIDGRSKVSKGGVEEKVTLADFPNRSVCAFARLTWKGYEFLELSKNEKHWKSAIGKVSKMAGGVTIDLVRSVLIQNAQTLLGL